jgi:hypothetical protein
MSKEYPSTLITFYPNGENETTTFGTKKEYPDIVKKERWIKTDDWRGYTDWELNKNYVGVADGWVTGFPDKTVSRKIELNDIFEDLKVGKIKPPCEIYWLFGITSNVFSTASMVAVKKGDEEVIENWLNEIDGGGKGLREMLS